MRLIIFIILFFASSAWAADIGCGKDTDQNGSVDAWCTGIFNCTDQDGDGYCTNGLGPNTGTDCNDQDFFDYPDPAAGTDSGCSSGQAKACQSDGTYTACQNFCPSDCLQCYYIDTASGNDTTGDGSWATPWKTAAMFSDATTPPSGHHTRIAGDCFGYKNSGTFGDTVTASGRSVGIDLGTIDGNSTNPIRVFGVPGKWPTFDSTGTASFVAIHDGSDYHKISGFKVINSVCNGYTNSVCVASDGSTGTRLYNLVTQNNSGADNTAGLMLSTGTNNEADHFFVLTQTQAGGNDDNTAAFLGYRGQNNSVHDFVLIQPNASTETFKVKHSDYSSEWDVKRFISSGGLMQFASRQTTIMNGLMLDSGIQFDNPGGTSFTGDETLQYLTFKNADGFILSIAGYLDYDIDGSGSADRCSSDYTIANIIMSDSIAQDSDASYPNKDDRFMFVGLYDSDPMFQETVDALSFPDNVFYNPNTTLSWAIFEAANATETCGGYGVLGGSYSFAQLSSSLTIDTTGSVVEDPSFDALNTADCASCTGKGWNANWGTAGGGGGASARKGQSNASGRKGQK